MSEPSDPPPRKPRRRAMAEDSDTPFTNRNDPRNRAALRAYICCLYGLIPGVGLILGPLGAFLGWRVSRQNRGDDTFKGQNLTRAAIFLGSLLALTNGVGLALMILGLASE